MQLYSILRPRFHFNSTWFQSILERRFVYSLQRSLITYPIWRLISYFLFLTEHKPGGEKERNCGSTCRYTRQGALFEARGREQWERLVLILIGSATRLENHECARPVLFLAVEINTFLCPWLSLSLSLSLSISREVRYLVCHLFLPLSFSPTRSFFLPDELPDENNAFADNCLDSFCDPLDSQIRLGMLVSTHDRTIRSSFELLYRMHLAAVPSFPALQRSTFFQFEITIL